MSQSRNPAPSRSHDDIRAVRWMVDELRAEPVPELEWDAIEQRLLTRLAAPSSIVRRAPAPSPFARVAGFAVAAAVLALGIASATSSGRMPSAEAPARHDVDVAQVALAPSGAHDLASLRVGDVVEAGATPVRFAQAGLVDWTLAPGSALRVRTVGLGHTVELERGSLRAEVTPRSPAEGLVEAFAVEVGGTRVAVHGTAFTVTREADRVVVDVEHGAVAVGPVGYVGATTGHLLVGPSRASFSLDGGRLARLLDRTAPPVAVAAADDVAPEPHGAPGPVAVREAPAAQEPAPQEESPSAAPRHIVEPVHPFARAPKEAPHTAAPEPTPEPPRLSADIVRARMDRCFRRAFEAAPSTLQSVTSTLSIDVNPDGSVRAARFSPPLTPELTACAGAAIHGLFPADTGHLDIPVSFSH